MSGRKGSVRTPSSGKRRASELFGSRNASSGCLPRVASSSSASGLGGGRRASVDAKDRVPARRLSRTSDNAAALGYSLPKPPSARIKPASSGSENPPTNSGRNTTNRTNSNRAVAAVQINRLQGSTSDIDCETECDKQQQGLQSKLDGVNDDDDELLFCDTGEEDEFEENLQEEDPLVEEEGGDGNNAEDAGFSEKELQEAEEATETLAEAEPKREAPTPYIRHEVSNYVHQIVSPFPHRMHTIAFLPTDKPFVGDPQHATAGAWVTPNYLDSIPCVYGKRRRIGRKGKFEDILYQLPEKAIRFSSVLGIFSESGFDETQEVSDKWSVRWCKRVEPEEYRALQTFQKVNHFPGTWGIGRKDNLHRRMVALRKRFPEEFYFAPDGFLLPQDARSLATDMQLKAHAPPGLNRNVYIVKQVASACGRQMRLLSKGSVPKGKWLVQRYIDNPLLIHGFKFDLRLYVVVTSFNPLRCFVYEEGLVRMASTPYPRENGDSKKGMKVKKITCHLTNYSINRHNKEGFVAPTDSGEGGDDEKASKWVLSTVKRYFQQRGLDWDGTWVRIEDLIIKTLLSCEADVAEKMRNVFPTNPAANSCFELFGFDVLLKEDLTPILMEVNIMPSLSTTCSLLDQRVKANMIADMLTLVGAYAPGKNHKRRPAKFGHPFLDDNNLSACEKDVIIQSEEEIHRQMHFKRIFPTAGGWDHYKQFFPESMRPLNTLLCEWEKAKETIPTPWEKHGHTSINLGNGAVAPNDATGGDLDAEPSSPDFPPATNSDPEAGEDTTPPVQSKTFEGTKRESISVEPSPNEGLFDKAAAAAAAGGKKREVLF